MYYRAAQRDGDVDLLFNRVCEDLLAAADVDTGHWQGKRGVPMTQTKELHNCVLELPIAATPGSWASFVHPNLPWTEDHFQERVSGEPLNPPPSHVDWPYNQAGNKDHMDGKVFSHSYPERLWPRYAPTHDRSPSQTGSNQNPGTNFGIRYEYGDLDDLVALLVREPYTRQAYVPLWFPEDLRAANQDQRVPCTLGYHFLLRQRQLYCFYPMRSLDWLRYFRDDAYMAGRLCQWVIDRCRERRTDDDNSIWHEVQPGLLTMHVVSLHVFTADVPGIQHRLSKKVRA